ncbi:MAG: o-succinylbenzoate synthase, partial [Actinobacteria bacterium]|nr:o-succinylbenzoate synthase [Actinomycetota bacterium]
MRLEQVELRRLNVPLRSAFRTSEGSVSVHEVVWVHVTTDVGEGWAECAANGHPDYSPEYHDGAAQVLSRFFIPELFKLGNDLSAEVVAPTLHWAKGHRMAKAAIEAAVLDAQLRSQNISLATYLGATQDRVRCGVSVGIMDTTRDLLNTVEGYLADGYLRIKLKIEPGWDIDAVRSVR